MDARGANFFAPAEIECQVCASYHRCAHTFMSAIAIAATVIFWL